MKYALLIYGADLGPGPLGRGADRRGHRGTGRRGLGAAERAMGNAALQRELHRRRAAAAGSE
jgi:hypothetical protein